jgi:hypothetical protein
MNQYIQPTRPQGQAGGETDDFLDAFKEFMDADQDMDEDGDFMPDKDTRTANTKQKGRAVPKDLAKETRSAVAVNLTRLEELERLVGKDKPKQGPQVRTPKPIPITKTTTPNAKKMKTT